jgi:F0F1-type ATP synthase assembly protein I
MNDNDSNLLKEIDSKLHQAKIKHQKTNDEENKTRIPSVMDMCAELIGPIILGILLGSYIDNRFKTSPYGFLILFTIGVVTGGFAIYRRSKKF